MKNQNGVVVHVVSPIQGRKFHLTREGLDVQLKKIDRRQVRKAIRVKSDLTLTL
jgi:hypothetical protein